MAATAGKIVAEIGFKLLMGYIEKSEGKDAAAQTQRMIDTIKAAQDAILTEIRDVIKGTEYAKETDKVETWLKQMKDGYRLISSGDTVTGEQELAKLRKGLGDGIDFCITRINGLLVGEYGGGGYIKLICRQLDGAFGSDDHGCDMFWYKANVDKFLFQQMYWQAAALALKLYSMRTVKNVDHYEEEMKKTFVNQMNYAYNNWHPLLRVFKNDYESFDSWDQLYNLRRPGQINRMLSKNGSNTEVHDHGAASDEANPCLMWRFINQVEKARAVCHPFNYSENGYSGSYGIVGVFAHGSGELFGEFVPASEGNRLAFWDWRCHQGTPPGYLRADVKIAPINVASNNMTDCRFKFLTTIPFTDARDNLMGGQWEICKKHRP